MGFAERLAELTEPRGSMARLSEATGLSTGLLSNYKNGTDPSLKNAVKIANALDVSLDYLAGRDGYAPKPFPAEPHAEPLAPAYSDPRQAALNGHYESLNDTSKAMLVDFAKSYAADPERRIVKEVPQTAKHKAAVGE